MSEVKRQSAEGPPMWVESLMTLAEWKQNCVLYPQTCRLKEPPQKSDPRYKLYWREGMGASVPKAEADKLNAGIEKLRQFHLKKAEDDRSGDKTES